MGVYLEDDVLSHSMFNKLILSAPPAPDWFLAKHLEKLISGGSTGANQELGLVQLNDNCDFELTTGSRMDAEVYWKVEYAASVVNELIFLGVD